MHLSYETFTLVIERPNATSFRPSSTRLIFGWAYSGTIFNDLAQKSVFSYTHYSYTSLTAKSCYKIVNA